MDAFQSWDHRVGVKSACASQLDLLQLMWMVVVFCIHHLERSCALTHRYIPERLLHARGTPRCLFLIFISALSALAVCFNAFASLPLLFPASIMAGVAFGATWSLMATLTSEFFGLHHFASNYTFIQVCNTMVVQKEKKRLHLPALI